MAYRFSLLAILFGLAACVNLTRPSIVLDDGGPGGDRPGGDHIDGLIATDTGDGPDEDVPVDGQEPLPDMGDAPDVELPPDAPLLANGQRCSAGEQCTSGLCIDGYCCNSACGDPCHACHLAGSEGTCTAVPAGQDPRNTCVQEAVASCGRDGTCDGQGACARYRSGTECAPGGCTNGVETAASTCDGNGTCRAGSTRNCAPNMCTGGSCAGTCTGHGDCQSGFFCESNRCTLKRIVGAVCVNDFECATGRCIDGACCSSPCSQSCYACNVASARGTCTPIPSGQDPQNECPAEAATTCGRAGGCNGMGGCRLHASGTGCGTKTCSGSTETAARTCNGSGVCLAGMIRDCVPYLCTGNACDTSCTSSAECKTGHYCAGSACVPFGAGPALYWKFDEASGTTATDSSGNGFSGSYIGAGVPAISSMVPPVRFPDPASRAFAAASRHAVRLASAPSAIRPSNNLTLSLWYRTTTLDIGHDQGATPGPRASEALSQGDNYFIRIRANDIAFTRRAVGGSYVSAFAPMTGHLDGNWHHVAAVLSPAGMKVYYDGVERFSNTRGENMLYDKGADLYVGRHGQDDPDWDFDGNIDDVRIYTRALPPDEVAAIAGGFF